MQDSADRQGGAAGSMSMAFQTFIHRAPRSYGAVAPSGPFLKSVVGVDFPEIGSERGPISPAANSCAALRSLSAAQRMIIGFQAISLLSKRSSPTSSHAPKALGMRKSSTAKRSASAAVAKRRYLVRLPFGGLERNSSAGAL